MATGEGLITERFARARERRQERRRKMKEFRDAVGRGVDALTMACVLAEEMTADDGPIDDATELRNAAREIRQAAEGIRARTPDAGAGELLADILDKAYEDARTLATNPTLSGNIHDSLEQLKRRYRDQARLHLAPPLAPSRRWLRRTGPA